LDWRKALGIFLVVVGFVGLLAPYALLPRGYDMAQAVEISEAYLESLNDPDLAIAEIMEFERNFYVVFYERSTGVGAFEMLIDKETGRIFPEYGPNMMWNTKYGHGGMGWSMMGMGGPMMGSWTGTGGRWWSPVVNLGFVLLILYDSCGERWEDIRYVKCQRA
jgi:hypothetical protein